MREVNDDSQDTTNPSPATKSEATAQCPARVGGGKTTTVFGALFGAAAAVPT
jgi:hypothetical protein